MTWGNYYNRAYTIPAGTEYHDGSAGKKRK